MPPTLSNIGLQIHTGTRRMGVEITQQDIRRLGMYLQLLEKWNQVHNLTGICDIRSMVVRHVLDSLSAVPFISGRRLLDVGSGAGLPGIPLALALPSLSVSLIDSRKKKAQFLRHAAMTLAMRNVEVVCGRVEQYRPDEKFDTLITRAFSSIAQFIENAGHLCADGGRMLALKGSFPAAELDDLDRRFVVTVAQPLEIPGLNASRHIVVLTREGPDRDSPEQ